MIVNVCRFCSYGLHGEAATQVPCLCDLKISMAIIATSCYLIRLASFTVKRDMSGESVLPKSTLSKW
jgi:hypothetical protein